MPRPTLPGLHFPGFGNPFLVFPSTQITIPFTDQPQAGTNTADADPIQTRTGEDKEDPDSGGQPITLCVSLQYLLPKDDKLGKIYNSFGTAYHERFVLITRNTISNIAQTFSPVDFWTKRTEVAEAMFDACKDALQKQGMVTLTQLQLLRIDFPKQYEDMITLIQLQVQTKATKEYEQQVTSVLKNLDVMQAQVQAQIGIINADAQRSVATIQNEASATGYILQQAAKANATRHVATTLGFDSSEVVQYLKLKAIKNHPSAKTVVGIPDPFSVDVEAAA
eukprot:FR738667.1.p1 GENE.FR738667.1~~FR738667.1.p1  ORF type:complete len:279 (-),score=38.60 FR738667.1:66-902(-)